MTNQFETVLQSLQQGVDQLKILRDQTEDPIEREYLDHQYQIMKRYILDLNPQPQLKEIA